MAPQVLKCSVPPRGAPGYCSLFVSITKLNSQQNGGHSQVVRSLDPPHTRSTIIAQQGNDVTRHRCALGHWHPGYSLQQTQQKKQKKQHPREVKQQKAAREVKRETFLLFPLFFNPFYFLGVTIAKWLGPWTHSNTRSTIIAQQGNDATRHRCALGHWHPGYSNLRDS